MGVPATRPCHLNLCEIAIARFSGIFFEKFGAVEIRPPPDADQRIGKQGKTDRPTHPRAQNLLFWKKLAEIDSAWLPAGVGAQLLLTKEPAD
jgi:hypothetical protein